MPLSPSTKREFHPYGDFIPEGARSMIIGSFPIGKFSDPERRDEIKNTEIDFFFGGERNLLWKILGEVFERPLRNKEEIINFLTEQKMGVGDVIKSCIRDRGRASDTDLDEIEWNKGLLQKIYQHNIHKLYFTSRKVEKWFQQIFPEAKNLELISLLSPSGQTARSIVRMPSYQIWLKQNPSHKPFDYLIQTYKEAFNKN
jgi:G:T/U-mismatch repair DNA glycosylase